MLLGTDGGDHYGTLAANMLVAGYATAGAPPSTARPRTGTHSFRQTGTGGWENRKTLDAVQNVLGVGIARYFDALPTDNTSVVLMRVADAGSAVAAYLMLNTDGSISLRSGSVSGTILGTSDPGVFNAGEYVHVESRWEPNGATGSLEVRINEVTKLDLVNIDIGTHGVISQFAWGVTAGPWGGSEDCADDVFWWNEQGSEVNDFVGDKKALRLMPDADKARSDMVRNTGSTNFGAISETTPDGDTTYLTGLPGDISEFGFEDLPTDIGSIVGLCAYVMMRKTDAGTCTEQTSMVSANTGSPPTPSHADGVVHSPGSSYGYGIDCFQVDPATGAPWLRAAVNAASLRIQRSVSG